MSPQLVGAHCGSVSDAPLVVAVLVHLYRPAFGILSAVFVVVSSFYPPL
jgi:hypothetical protein